MKLWFGDDERDEVMRDADMFPVLSIDDCSDAMLSKRVRRVKAINIALKMVVGGGGHITRNFFGSEKPTPPFRSTPVVPSLPTSGSTSRSWGAQVWPTRVPLSSPYLWLISCVEVEREGGGEVRWNDADVMVIGGWL